MEQRVSNLNQKLGLYRKSPSFWSNRIIPLYQKLKGLKELCEVFGFYLSLVLNIYFFFIFILR